MKKQVRAIVWNRHFFDFRDLTMSSSSSCIVSIIRLLKHFDLINGQKFQQLLMKELECANEAQLWCKILPSLSTVITNQSLSSLKEETMKIAEQQPALKHTHSINKSKRIPSISIYKYIQQKYKDPISNLHSDIIDYLGTFLDKKQSIELGYLNKQLYIETQKQSYLLKRRNDPMFSINDFTADRFHWKQTNPFAYSLPQKIHIGVKPYQRFNHTNYLLQSSKWYKNIYYVLNEFTCQNFGYLANIPIDKLFGKQGHFKHYQYNARLPEIEKFTCMLREKYKYSDQHSLNSVNIFCSNFSNYYTRYCANNVENIRNIKQLVIDQHYTHDGKDQQMRKTILLTLGKISKKIKINNSYICFNNKMESKEIFQPNLKVFEFDSSSRIFFDEVSSDHDDLGLIEAEFELSFILKNSLESFRNFVRDAKRVNLDSKIKCYKLSIYKLSRLSERNWMIIFRTIFNINSEYYDSINNININVGNGKTKTLVLKITRCDPQLRHVFDIFEILHKYRLQILDSTRNNVTTVVFELYFGKQEFELCIQSAKLVWSNGGHIDHSPDEKKIKYQDCDLSKEALGAIYHDTIQWFQKIQKKHGNGKLYECHYLEIELEKQVKSNLDDCQ